MPIDYQGKTRVFSFPDGTPQEEIDASLRALGELPETEPSGGRGLRFRTDITSASPQASSPPPGPEFTRRAGAALTQAAPWAASGPAGAIPAAVSGGAAFVFPPGKGSAESQVAQSASEVAVQALMNRFAPGAGFLPRAAATGVANYGASGAADQYNQSVGNPRESQIARVLSAIISGGFGGLTAKPGTELPAVVPQDGDFASGLPGYINKAVSNPKGALLSFIKGDDEVVSAANLRFNDFVENRGAVLSQDQLLDAANTLRQSIEATRVSGKIATSGAVAAAEDAFIRATKLQKPNAEALLKTMFMGSGDKFDPALVADAAVTLDNYLKQTNPELAEQIKNTFFVRSVVYGSLKQAEEGQSGVKKLIESAGDRTSTMAADRAAVGPGGLINYKMVPETGEYILDGAKFQKHIQTLGPNLDLVFGKNSQAALEDVAEVMRLLDPSTGEKSFRHMAAAFLGAGLKYNAHRLMFFGSQLGAGGGGPQVGGLIKGGLLATAAIGGAIHLDDFAKMAVKNPDAIRQLRLGLSEGKADLARIGWRRLQEAAFQPYRDPEQPQAEAMPTTR